MKKYVLFFLLFMMTVCVPLNCLASSSNDNNSITCSSVEIEKDRASRTVYVSSSSTTVYECPVKKNHVFVTWNSSAGPTSVTLSFYYKNSSGVYTYYESKSISLGGSVASDLPNTAQYKIYAVKTAGSSGNCTFTITGTN